jgi:hypothetical protein
VVAFVITIPILIKQVKVSNKVARFQAFHAMQDMLTNEVLREKRKKVLNAESVDTVRSDAIDVARIFNRACEMVKYGFVEEEVLMERWAYSLDACWRKVQGIVLDNRRRDNTPGVDRWAEFEEYAKKAEEYLARMVNQTSRPKSNDLVPPPADSSETRNTDH